MTDANRNLLLRIGSALVLAPPLVLSVLWKRPEGVLAWVLVAVLVGLDEFYRITLKGNAPWLRLLAVACGGGVTLLTFYAPVAEATLAALVVATLVLTTAQLLGHRELETASADTGLMLMGLLYVPLLLTPLALLKRLPEGGSWIILTFCITWFADTGAYAVGRAIGKRKLYPRISPKKSVEGALGGVLAAVGAGALARAWYLPTLNWTDVLLLGIVGSVLDMVGDLVESMVKRSYGVKDSGRVIPGHGGLLDRIDGLLFVVPYVYLYARYLR